MSDRHVKRYAAYKENGVEWIGEVPAHWSFDRIKNVTKTQSGTTPKSDQNEYYENGDIDWIRTTDLNNGHLYESEYKITVQAVNQCGLKCIPINSVLIAMYGGMGTIGKHSLLLRAATINQSVCAILPHPKRFSSNFLWYYVQYFRPHWELFADSARKDPNINQEAIKRLWLLLPPLPEQAAIAAYLDTKTAQIDRQVELLSKKATQYGKLKQSLINETVTRGLDSSVPMKESGVEWIGEVPAHWEVKRVKGFVNLKKGKTPNDFSDDPKHLPYLSMEFLREKNSTVNYVIPQKNLVVIADGELLVLWDGANAGEILIGKKGYLSSTMAVIKAKASLLNKSFFFFFLKSLEKSFKDFSNGTTIPHFAPDVLTGEIFGIPPLPEQTAIAAYLDTKTAQIDRIVSTINIQIGKLKELRKTLINDVVTGKIKVIPHGELA